VIRGYITALRADALVRSRFRFSFFHARSAGGIALPNRQLRRQCDLPHPWVCLDSTLDFLPKVPPALLLVGPRVQVHSHCDQILGMEPRIRLPRVAETANKQPRTDQHDDRNRDLCYNQRAASIRQTTAAALSGCHSLDHSDKVWTRSEHCGSQTKDHAG